MGKDGNVAKILLLIPACHRFCIARYYQYMLVSISYDYIIYIYIFSVPNLSLSLSRPLSFSVSGDTTTELFCDKFENEIV